MKRMLIAIGLLFFVASPILAEGILGNDLGVCFPPAEPYPYKLNKSDLLYGTARNEHQTYLEQMEAYVNCLDRERSRALSQFQQSFNLFLKNYGDDAVFKYGADD